MKALTTSLLIALPLMLVGCTGDERPFEEAIEAAENNIASLEVTALPGVLEPPTIRVGERIRLTAIAFNPAGVDSEFDTEDRNWSVSDTSVASIDRNGILLGRADGQVDVSLDFGGVSTTSLTVNVSSAALAGVTSINGPSELEACQGAEYLAIGTLSDGNDVNLLDVDWAREPVDSTELISQAADQPGRIVLVASEPGQVMLSATSDGFSLSTEFEVLDNLTDLSFPSGLRAVDEGSTIELSAIGTYTREDADTLVDVTEFVSWSVTDGTGSATITNGPVDRGALTGVGSGTVNVEVVCGGFRASNIVQITSDDDDDDDGLAFANGTSLTVSLTSGGTQLAVSTGSSYDQDNDVSDDVTWQSLDTSIVSITSDGVIFPMSAGTVTILVTLDEESATLSVTVV